MARQSYGDGAFYRITRKDIYPNLERELIRRRMNVSTLADLIGISRPAMYEKRKGRNDFRRFEMFEIKKALGSEMTLDELFRRSDEK